MADGDKKAAKDNLINERERFRYIGFEVFPGKAKDLFKSDAEKKKLIETARAKREKGDVIREECTLLEERISGVDRIVMLVACVTMVACLFLPWYSAYSIIEDVAEEPVEAVVDSTSLQDSTALALAGGTDSLGVAGEAAAESVEETTEELAAADTVTTEAAAIVDEGPKEEVLHGYVATKKIQKEYTVFSGFSSFAALGTIGGPLFSSGFILVITGILFIVWMLLCIGLPAYTLLGLFGGKGSPDQKALKLKKILKLNWIPLGLFLVTMIISFIGAEYGFDSSLFANFGDAYGPIAYFGTISWGVFVSVAASIILAVKGVEI